MMRLTISNQTNVVKELVISTAPNGFKYIYEKYLNQFYHFLKFDILEHPVICKTIALKFSNHPDIFLGSRRTEIQIDNNSVTLSVNVIDIESDSLPMIKFRLCC